jgi:prolyl-tRNA synthetase
LAVENKMRWTQNLIPTLKETPQEAQIKSHRLMLRAGLVRKLASGTYSYLPLGLRALNKAIQIVREEMDAAGALEVLLPAIHPSELWRESGRWDILGEDMIHFKDRHGKENVLGPTHEEVITDLARREIHSYKQLPVTLYQIQTKFRDEIRPRSGVIRSREFIMKDAYSFHAGLESLDETYQLMKETYKKIFTRCGLDFHIVQADPGAMGGSGSQEFVLFSEAGEDRMVRYGESDVVMSVEMASRVLKGLKLTGGPAENKHKKVHTPGHSSVDSVCKLLGKKPADLVKTMIYETLDPSAPHQGPFAVLVRGDHEVSHYKISKEVPGAYLASRETISAVGSEFGFSGPLGLHDKNNPIPFYIDEDVLLMKDVVVGANSQDYHLVDVNISDIVHASPARKISVGDYRQVTEGDKGQAAGKEMPLHFKTAIELGHIFKLGLRYSGPMKAHYLDQTGKENPMIMGCYGIGVNRILAAAIEQCADDKGIVWPKNISPFGLLVILIDSKDAQSTQIAENLLKSEELKKSGIDILVDDRPDSAGVKFNDADLIGIPLRVVLGPKNLKAGKAEIKIRKTGEIILVDLDRLVPEILSNFKRI